MFVSCPAPTLGDDDRDRCNCCGCQSACSKVCRPVPGTKKVTKVEYSVKCEDFCVPGPSARTTVCDECGHKKIVYTPTCAEVRTRKKLVKTETVRKVPTTEWVVENLCASCARKCDARVNPDGESPANPDDTRYGAAAESEAPTGSEQAASLASRTPGKALMNADVRRVFQPLFGEK